MTHASILYIPLCEDSPFDITSLQTKSKADVAKGTLSQALRMRLGETFHLIIVDARAVTTGVENACTKLRRQFQNPLLVLVSNPDEKYLVSLYAREVDECIVSPHSIDLLVAKMESWLRWATTSDIVKHQVTYHE